MDLAFQPGISVCDVGGRLVFLDVTADRYFCLVTGTEEALRKVMGGGAPDDHDRSRLDGLVERRILARSSIGPRIAPCQGPAPAMVSLVEGTMPRPSGWSIVMAMAAMIASIVRLRTRPLATNIAAACTTASGAPPEDQILPRLARLAAAFDRASSYLSTHDRCLAQSLAVARAARRKGLPVQLVFGIALGPFVAHCWIQSGPVVVNDRLETIRDYTPILVR